MIGDNGNIKEYYTENIDEVGFGKLDRLSILDGLYSHLTPSARVVLPVLAAFTNCNGDCMVDEDRLVAYTGFTRRTLRNAFHDLRIYPMMKVRHYKTTNGNSKVWFKFERPIDWIPIHRSLFHSGCWLNLHSSAISVYISIRALSFKGDGEELYTYNGTVKKVSELARVKYDRMKKYISSLEVEGLVERGDGGLIVNTSPKVARVVVDLNAAVSSIRW